MGTIPLWRTKRTDGSGKTWHFDIWTTTSDLADEEKGVVTFSISSSADADEPSHVLWVCAADYDERWSRRFVDAFASVPEFRERFAVSEQKSSHKTVKCDLPGGGSAEVDEKLAAAVVKLNSLGAVTAFSCQGGGDGGSEVAYIALENGSFPDELVAAWKGAGFDVSLRSVHADAPFGLENEAARGFLQSLDDWLAGNLDVSGERYRVRSPRPSSLPRLPKVALASVQPHVRKDVQRLVRLGAKARFSDYARLRSGRDNFSAMKLGELEKAVDSPTLRVVDKAGLDGSDAAKALRWALRGLPADMAVHKVKVDLEIGLNARGARRY